MRGAKYGCAMNFVDDATALQSMQNSSANVILPRVFSLFSSSLFILFLFYTISSIDRLIFFLFIYLLVYLFSCFLFHVRPDSLREDFQTKLQCHPAFFSPNLCRFIGNGITVSDRRIARKIQWEDYRSLVGTRLFFSLFLSFTCFLPYEGTPRKINRVTISVGKFDDCVATFTGSREQDGKISEEG